ncbi:hypothetical protein C5748_00925 [Phyllobacterium phragmitis]|uniref:Uncharacterized protein n=1 Tax=Phyllobacterium phragmitis TaxID=2670329 RepID=A0A2S9IYZ7_9HYPH|nr:hypothetical protein C5748_00925 [Phyllobacterium phragmitis]
MFRKDMGTRLSQHERMPVALAVSMEQVQTRSAAVRTFRKNKQLRHFAESKSEQRRPFRSPVGNACGKRQTVKDLHCARLRERL